MQCAWDLNKLNRFYDNRLHNDFTGRTQPMTPTTMIPHTDNESLHNDSCFFFGQIWSVINVKRVGSRESAYR